MRKAEMLMNKGYPGKILKMRKADKNSWQEAKAMPNINS